MVEALLDRGANVEAPVGQLQTTPLQWAIWHKKLDVTRLLLDKKASRDSINMRGWNAVFFCWSRLRDGEPDMMEFLNELAKDYYLDLDIADVQHWTALDRVAAVGTSDEVRRLIDLGADPHQEAMPLRWNALHQAVFHGNRATFQALLPAFRDEVRSMTDERGWTLLHIAASAGHDDVVKDLLRLRADREARSEPFKSHMPESLFGQSCTPQEVAGAQGPEREQQFLQAVRDFDLSSGCIVVQSGQDAEENAGPREEPRMQMRRQSV